MFRKIRSNRGPGHTVLSELKRELGPYLHKATEGLESFIGRRPTLIFRLMVLGIIASAVVSFTIFRPGRHDTTGNRSPHNWPAVTDVFAGVNETRSVLADVHWLKHLIDSLSAKTILTAQDSARLEQALDRFQQFSKKLNQRKNEH